MTNNCIFCQIVLGKVPCHKIYEDEKHLAFLDIHPNTKGMTVVIPKKHFDSYVFDMPGGDYIKLLETTKKIGKTLDKALECKRTAIVMEGLGVNHVHIKLYPLHGIKKKFEKNVAKEVKFFKHYEGYLTTSMGPRAKDEELKKIETKIRKVFLDV